MHHSIESPLTREALEVLHAGDTVSLSGILYTARDAAHKRLCALLMRGEALPFALEGASIYYVGPCPPLPGRVIGACGPTTSGRMDSYTPALLAQGLRCMIGKGPRNACVQQAMQAHGAVYLAATGGAGALLAQCVLQNDPVAFEDLGAEAIHRLTVRDMPLVVAMDAHGGNLYQQP